MNAFERVMPRSEEKIKELPNVAQPRELTKDQLELDILPRVWRHAKNDIHDFSDSGDSQLSLGTMAGIAISQSLNEEYGEIFALPHLQYTRLVWEYASHLASEKLLWIRRGGTR